MVSEWFSKRKSRRFFEAIAAPKRAGGEIGQDD